MYSVCRQKDFKKVIMLFCYISFFKGQAQTGIKYNRVKLYKFIDNSTIKKFV